MHRIIELRDVSFTYKQRSTPSVAHINLHIVEGDFVLLTGATGCGKSTLLKTLNGLIPHESGGVLTGQVFVDGRDTRAYGVAQLSQTVGMVFQSPDDQIFSTTVFDETAFVLENSGMGPREVRPRVHEALRMVGLLEQREAAVHTLSGGQKQRLAVAAVLAAQPRVLALDEPISQLDPGGAGELLSVLQYLNQTLGLTIVIVEHRLHEVMPLCRRVVLMAEGRLVWQGTREEAIDNAGLFDDYGLRLPQTADICRRLHVSAASLQVGEAVTAIAKAYHIPAVTGSVPAVPPLGKSNTSTPAIAIRQLSFSYGEAGPLALRDIHLTVPGGQFVALMGNNGAGKSTLLQQIAGLLQPVQGSVCVLGKPVKGICPGVGMVMQNPDFMLFNDTVREEIVFALRQQTGKSAWTPHCRRLVQRLGLDDMETEFPLALSRGQRLRVALAAVLAGQPAVLLLDEPTTGQDIAHIKELAGLLREYTAQGGTVMFCTHDAEVAAQFADRIVVMCQGAIVADGPPAAVFQQRDMLQAAGIKPPAALLVAQRLYGGTALTVEEVVNYVQQACVGSSAG